MILYTLWAWAALVGRLVARLRRPEPRFGWTWPEHAFEQWNDDDQGWRRW